MEKEEDDDDKEKNNSKEKTYEYVVPHSSVVSGRGPSPLEPPSLSLPLPLVPLTSQASLFPLPPASPPSLGVALDM